MTIRLLTLGGMRVLRNGEAIDALPAQRLRCALLLYIALERETTRESVAALFWPERDPERARHSLSQTLYELRQQLGEDWLEAQGETLRATGAVSIDALDFEAAVERGDPAAAIELYQGHLLDGVHLVDSNAFEQWLDLRRAQLRRLHRGAARTAIDARVDADEPAAALALARRWVELDPFDDEAQHKLVELLAVSGARAEALRQYDSYAALLAADGLEPLDETRELVERIRTGVVGNGHATRDVEDVEDVAAEAAVAPVAGGGGAPVGAWPPTRRLLRVAAAVALAVGLAGGYAVWQNGARAKADTIETAAPALDPTRVAVLYLDDHSRGGELQHVAAGLTEALIHELSQVPALKVVSRNGVKPYRSGEVAFDSIVADLDVGTVVEGSIMRVGDTLQVTVQLVDGATGEHFLSRELRRPWDDLLRLQDDVAHEVSRMLRQRIGEEIQLRRRRSRTDSPEAWELVQRAERVQEDAWRLLEAGDGRAAQDMLGQADSLLARAERLDPEWIDPIVRRGRFAWARMRVESPFTKGSPGSNTAVMRRQMDVALGHAARAMAAEPENPAALELRGTLRFAAWDAGLAADSAEAASLLRGAESDLREAIGRDRDRAHAMYWLSELLRRRGDFVEAKLWAERAYETDAFLSEAWNLLYRLGQISLDLEQTADALKWCEEGLSRFPGRPHFPICALVTMAVSPDVEPDIQRAWELHEALLESTVPEIRPLHDATGRLQVAAVIARAGLRDSARHVVQRALAHAPSTDAKGGLLYYTAIAHVQLEEPDRAIEALRAYLEGMPQRRSYIAEDWAFRPLWLDPRFEELVGNRPPDSR